MKLVVAIDLSPITEKVIEEVKKISRKMDPKIWIIHVVAPDPDFIGYDVGPQTERDFIAKKYHEKHVALQDISKKMKADGFNVTPLLLQGPTVQAILEQADDVGADMIITGSHGFGMMYNLFIGSVSKEILKRSARPVLIIPVKERE